MYACLPNYANMTNYGILKIPHPSTMAIMNSP